MGAVAGALLGASIAKDVNESVMRASMKVLRKSAEQFIGPNVLGNYRL